MFLETSQNGQSLTSEHGSVAVHLSVQVDICGKAPGANKPQHEIEQAFTVKQKPRIVTDKSSIHMRGDSCWPVLTY